jgi:hypothetical protein
MPALLDDLADIHLRLAELQFVTRHPWQIQQIVDEPPQMWGLSGDDA